MLEIPGLGELKREYEAQGKRLQFVGINLDQMSENAWLQRYVASLGARDFLWATDTEFKTVLLFNIRTAGKTVILDRQGRIIYQDNGPTKKWKLRQEIDRALESR